MPDTFIRSWSRLPPPNLSLTQRYQQCVKSSSCKTSFQSGVDAMRWVPIFAFHSLVFVVSAGIHLSCTRDNGPAWNKCYSTKEDGVDRVCNSNGSWHLYTLLAVLYFKIWSRLWLIWLLLTFILLCMLYYLEESNRAIWPFDSSKHK